MHTQRESTIEHIIQRLRTKGKNSGNGHYINLPLCSVRVKDGYVEIMELFGSPEIRKVGNLGLYQGARLYYNGNTQGLIQVGLVRVDLQSGTSHTQIIRSKDFPFNSQPTMDDYLRFDTLLEYVKGSL